MVSHHDIKTENILLDAQGNVKICDFGVSEKFLPTNECCVFYGTPAFQAPEIVSNTKGNSFDGRKADVWAAGVVLFSLLTGGCLPYRGSTVYLMMRSIEEDPVPFPECTHGPDLDAFLRRVLEKDPLKRPTACEALDLPFLLEHDATPGSSSSLVHSHPVSVSVTVTVCKTDDKDSQTTLKDDSRQKLGNHSRVEEKKSKKACKIQ
jgi:serine/threonine protein kinase